jgi:hypothetical protein
MSNDQERDNDKQRDSEKRMSEVGPRDAQKGGQGGVSRDHPENRVEEREPEKHKS